MPDFGLKRDRDGGLGGGPGLQFPPSTPDLVPLSPGSRPQLPGTHDIHWGPFGDGQHLESKGEKFYQERPRSFHPESRVEVGRREPRTLEKDPTPPYIPHDGTRTGRVARDP